MIARALAAREAAARRAAARASLEHARALRERTAAENAVPAPSQSPAGQSPSASPDDPFTAEILSLIEARRVAKQQKNFAEADRIRSYLSDRGVTLVDTKDGTTFRKN